jgi:hypothetical protein
LEGIELSFTKLTLRDPVRRLVVFLKLDSSLCLVVDLRTTETPVPFDKLHTLAMLRRPVMVYDE